jgi:hypothetical protein
VTLADSGCWPGPGVGAVLMEGKCIDMKLQNL